MMKVRGAAAKIFFLCTLTCMLLSALEAQDIEGTLQVNDLGYFDTPGLNVLVFSNTYDGLFSDAKISGIELIHHGVRTATNGDVRLSPTPGQWDPIPQLVDRKTDKATKRIEAFLTYAAYGFSYSISAEARENGIVVRVQLNKPLPVELEGRAGFELEFLPSAYFQKTYLMDGKSGNMPLYPTGPMETTRAGTLEPLPIASGRALVLAPEDPERRVSITTRAGVLNMYDGRNIAQNGWYVVRTLIPSGVSGNVIEWFLTANTIPQWRRRPVIEYSQVGYHPAQKKIAVIECDARDTAAARRISLIKFDEDGRSVEKFSAVPKQWGKYLRYSYATVDFSSVTDSGVYALEYEGERTSAFRIDPGVYDNAWQPTLDIFLPVQMDHMKVNEAYRVWHGASHLDDALQAPVNHEHFDLYAQGPTTDTPFKPGEHIPGLNIGGWYDAGDDDIRTQTHYSTISMLVQVWEQFGLKRDETAIDQKRRYVDIHHPDGIPDVLQQIEHGTLQLIAQYRAVGHAIPGIITHTLAQYAQLGDRMTMTDNLVYNPHLDSLQSDGLTSGTFDDRWAFTSRSTPLDYGSAAALAAASRALRGYNDTLAQECLATAQLVWQDEHSHQPYMFRSGNTTGGALEAEELKAAVELLICTKDARYADRINALLPEIEKVFMQHAAYAVRALPYMDHAYGVKIRSLAEKYAADLAKFSGQNPYGVFITTGGWAGNGMVINVAVTNYLIHKAYPDLIGKETIYAGLNYIYGCHPGSNISFVSGVGTTSKKIAYGNNRADFSFIAGGIVPGVLILKPDYPENKEDWPFLWGENEYVVNLAPAYIYLVNAEKDLLNEK